MNASHSLCSARSVLLRRMTPNLWEDGLAEPAFAADLERNGGKSSVARAIVRRLAEELSRRAREEMHLRPDYSALR
jgi:hypothetical protein